MIDTAIYDLNQFEDAPENNNDSVISSNSVDVKINEQINKFKTEISDIDDDELEEDFDSDYDEIDDFKPEHKGPNNQVIKSKFS